MRNEFIYMEETSRMKTNVKVLRNVILTMEMIQFVFFKAEVKLAGPCSRITLKENLHNWNVYESFLLKSTQQVQAIRVTS